MNYKLAQDMTKIGEAVEEYIAGLEMKYGSTFYHGKLYIHKTDIQKEVLSDDHINWYREVILLNDVDIHEEYENSTSLKDIIIDIPYEYMLFEDGYDTPIEIDPWGSERESYNAVEFLEKMKEK